MQDLFKFNLWGFINEVRRPRACPEELRDFTPLRKSIIYKDLYAFGYIESSPLQGEKQGNLRFQHPDMQKAIVFNRKGRIWEIDKRESGSNRSKENIIIDPDIEMPIIRDVSTDDSGHEEIIIQGPGQKKYAGECLTLKDFEIKLEYLIKRLLWKQGWIETKDEVSDEAPGDMIIRIITENPNKIKTLKAIPPSMIDHPQIGMLYKAFMNYKGSMELLSWCKKNAPHLYAKLITLEKEEQTSTDDKKKPASRIELASDLGDFGFSDK